MRSIGTPASSIDKQPPEREREREREVRGASCVVSGEWRMVRGLLGDVRRNAVRAESATVTIAGKYLPHTDAMDDDPLDSVIVLSTRMV